MVLYAIVFLLGVGGFQFLPTLPPIIMLLIIPATTLMWILLPRGRLLWVLLVGFGWAHAHAILYFQHRPDESIAGQNIQVIGVVSDIPLQQGKVQRFELDIESFELPGYNGPVPRHIRLSWYYSPALVQAGERWQLTIRLKPPHGFMNPGGFDYEAWLYQKGLHATGYVRKQSSNQRRDALVGSYVIQRLRQYISTWINQQLQGESAGILTALAVGHRGGISPEAWDRFIKTGTNHLMAISGLHIGLIAALGYWLGRRLLPGRILHRVSRIRVAVITSMMFATVYAALAGFTVPTQRALIMLMVVYGGLFFYRQISATQTLAVALLAVLIWSPLAVLSAGFWFSFLAVAAIVYVVANRVPSVSKGWAWGRIQLAVVIALLPLSLFFFQQGSLIAPLANTLAIPWIGGLVVPLVMLAILLLPVSDTAAQAVITVAGHLLDESLPLLDGLAASDYALMYLPQPSYTALLLACLAVLLLLAPRGLPARWLAGILMLPLLFNRVPTPESGEFEFVLLDVGQGLSAVVRTARHTLVFDTGARFSETFDTGDRVVVPYLRQQGVNNIDILMISNGDRDHIGGAESVLAAFPVGAVWGRDIELLQHDQKITCERGQQWQWDDVQFEVLHPADQTYTKRNNHSCVLKISNNSASVLIAADIEKKAERLLLSRLKESLSADVLVVPHHGSKTSSSVSFITAVNPDYALYATGYLNRFDFPRPEIIERYQAFDAIQLNTADSGAIRFMFDTDTDLQPPTRYREQSPRYWRNNGL